MGYVSQTIRDLSIPRNGQDTFVLPLDRTTGHHDSAQLVIKHKSTQPIVSSSVPSDSDQTTQLWRFMYIKQCLTLFFF